MYCHNCGKQVGDNSRFCRYCGADLREGASKHEQGETDAADGQGAQEKKSDDIFGFNAQNGGQQGNGGYNAQNGGQQGNGGYNAPPPQYTRYTDPDDRRSVGFGVLGFFIPLVGFILWLVWRDSMPQRARSCAIGALVGVIVYVIFVIISVALSLTFAADIFEEYYYYYY